MNSEPSRTNFFSSHHFLPCQLKWIDDPSPLKIIQKSRQIGITYADAFDSVCKASPQGARHDVWVSSRDEAQSKLYLEDCKYWARILDVAARDLGELVLDPKKNLSAHVLQFANTRRIYCLSSNPNALAGKRGHVKLDEFALHQDQRLLYRVAKPVTTWGGQLSIISTHRGANTVFNQLIRDILHNGNPMGWSLHTVTIHDAVSEGLVEKIAEQSGRAESRDHFLARVRAECIDEEQWLQEYCCVPVDESAAFITHDMVTACEDPNLHLLTLDEFVTRFRKPSPSPMVAVRQDLFVGVDVGRKKHLCVIDVGERIDGVVHDRLRIELLDQPHSKIKADLLRILAVPGIKGVCVDATGMGGPLAESACEYLGSRAQQIVFTSRIKEQLAFALRNDFESLALRLPIDSKLRADLRGIKKEVTAGGQIRFIGDCDDSHCDRFWAKALRQHAARPREEAWALVC